MLVGLAPEQQTKPGEVRRFRAREEPMRRIDPRIASSRTIGAILGAVTGALVLAVSPAVAADEPLVIAKQGNFYIGGRYVETKGDTPMVGQAYVQFQVPQRQVSPYPIIMIHG